MRAIIVTYHESTVAVCGPERVVLADAIEVLERDHPRRLFVEAMCLFAGDVIRGDLLVPYGDAAACRYARALRVPAHDLAARLHDSDAALAEDFNVPLDELRLARLDLVAHLVCTLPKPRRSIASRLRRCGARRALWARTSRPAAARTMGRRA